MPATESQFGFCSANPGYLSGFAVLLIPKLFARRILIAPKMGPEISTGSSGQSGQAGFGSDDFILLDDHSDAYTPGIDFHFYTHNPTLGANEHFHAFGNFCWERE
jgi:hypothetical protein